jgi:hypothetical protein
MNNRCDVDPSIPTVTSTHVQTVREGARAAHSSPTLSVVSPYTQENGNFPWSNWFVGSGLGMAQLG